MLLIVVYLYHIKRFTMQTRCSISKSAFLLRKQKKNPCDQSASTMMRPALLVLQLEVMTSLLPRVALPISTVGHYLICWSDANLQFIASRRLVCRLRRCVASGSG